MKDTELVQKLIDNDPAAIHEFFFVRCRDIFTYIGQYFCNEAKAENIIGEAYEVLSADDWHKLRIFKFSSSLVTYVSVIIARHFQHKRNHNAPTEYETIVKLSGKSENESGTLFLMSDIRKTLQNFSPLDQTLIQRILMDGEKPRDVMDDVRELIRKEEGEAFVAKHSPEQFSGYVYTRYFRVRTKFQNYMRSCGYGK